MSVLVFVESINNKYKKAAFEAVSYGAQLAQAQGGTCTVVTNGSADIAGELGKYGAAKVLNFTSNDMHDTGFVTQVITKAFDQVGAKHLVISDNSRGKALSGRLSVRLNAGVVTAAEGLPDSDGKIKRAVYSGKAFAAYAVSSDKSIISISRNAVPVSDTGSAISAEAMDVAGIVSATSLVEVKRVEGTIPLPEAELVVSAGRGMKGPENWGIIDDLADVLGAVSYTHLTLPTKA